MRRVQDEGSKSAKLVLVGEAPGRREDEVGRPFVGPSGARLEYWWREVGLSREDFYITNVYPYRPPGNDLKKVPKVEVERWIDDLHNRLAELHDPWLIVPTGDTALRALVGKSGILKHRGSIYAYTDRQGRKTKVIPTIHPAATFREPSLIPRCRHDWRRIAEDSRFRDLRLPQREHFIEPTLDDIRAFVEACRQDASVLALDIEVLRSVRQVEVGRYKNGKPKLKKVMGESYIGCIGFAYEPDFSLTIPTTTAYWGVALPEVMELIRELVEGPWPKVTQNGQFDFWWIKTAWGFFPTNWEWDTLAMHHCLEPTEPHSMAYMQSIYTRQPYHKSEDSKSPDEVMRFAKNTEALWTYNGIDVCVTLELAYVLSEKLAEAGLMEFYQNHYRRLFEPMLDMMLGGIRVDTDLRARMRQALEEECASIRQRLEAIAGYPLHGEVDLSHTKVKKFLYETLKLPPVKKRGEDRVTSDEVALRKLRLKYAEKAGPAIDLILEHRRKAKLAEFYDADAVDPDGYIRSTYKFGTETGRLSSAKAPHRRGANLFNIDREAREQFMPDPGHIFIELDASQAESRIVNLLTRDPDLVRIAKSSPWEFDQHRFNASIIFAKPESEITKEQRTIAKAAVHGSNYGLAEKRLSEMLLMAGYIKTPEECEAMMEAYLKRFPAIREVYQKQTRLLMIRDRRLTNSFGRTLRFDNEKMDDEAFRRGFAFLPQCLTDKAEVLTQRGFIPAPLLKNTDLVAQWNPTTSEITFVRPLRIIRERYQGPLISLRGKRVALDVTPTHKVGYGTSGTFHVKKAEDLVGYARLALPVSGKYKGPINSPLTRSVVELLVATQADGSLKPGQVTWHLKKPRKIERLKSLLKRAGVAYTVSHHPDGSQTFSTGGAWRAVVDVWLPDKRFTPRLLELPLYHRACLIREAALWDGSRRTREGASFVYNNTDEVSVDVLQMIGVSCGYRAYKALSSPEEGAHKACWHLSLCKTPWTTGHAVKGEDYDGLVYCVTVPTGFFVVRQAGCVMITGNSDCADYVKQYGLLPVWEFLQDHPELGGRVCTTVYDSLLISCPPTSAWEIYRFAQANMQRAHNFYGEEMAIPVEVKVGLAWGGPHTREFKRPPSRQEFEEAIQALVKNRLLKEAACVVVAPTTEPHDVSLD